jgi:hypothetical protein
MSSLLAFNRVYRLEIQSVAIFDPSYELLPLCLLSDLPHPYPLPKVNLQLYRQFEAGERVGVGIWC